MVGKVVLVALTLGLLVGRLHAQEVTHVATIRFQSDPIFALSFTPAGSEVNPNSNHGKITATTRNVAPAGAVPREHIRYSDRATGKELGTLDLGSGSFPPVISPDGKTVATYLVGDITLYDVESGQKRTTLYRPVGFVRHVAFSPDGQSMVSCGNDGLRLRDIATGRTIRTFSDPKEYCSVAFSPDGARLAAGTFVGDTELWEVATGRLTGQLGGHKGYVRGLAFSPDGTLLVTAAQDDTARVWDLATSRSVATLQHPVPVTAVAFNHNGRTLASADTGGRIKLWSISAK